MYCNQHSVNYLTAKLLWADVAGKGVLRGRWEGVALRVFIILLPCDAFLPSMADFRPRLAIFSGLATELPLTCDRPVITKRYAGTERCPGVVL